MTDTATVSLLTACFNRLPDERKSEILGIAEAFAFTQRDTDCDPWTVMNGILREPESRGLEGKLEAKSVNKVLKQCGGKA